MLGYLLRRVLAAIPVMGVVALFVFLLLRLTPGDPAAILAGDNASPEQLERIRTSLGLNEPSTPSSSPGSENSSRRSRRVSDLERAGPEDDQPAHRAVDLDRLSTIVLSILVAVPLGVIAAWKHGTWIDRFVMGLSVLGFSVPVFVIGYVLIEIFRDRPALGAGAGLQEHHRRLRAILRAHHPADLHAVLYLCRADRTHDAGLDARRARRGLCPHRACQGH
jgi:peptide/nickel transport system permease protein